MSKNRILPSYLENDMKRGLGPEMKMESVPASAASGYSALDKYGLPEPG